MADPPTPGRKQDTVVIRYGNGGRVDEHRQRFADYRLTKTKVEIRGLLFGLHAAMEKGERMDYETWQAYNSMPPEIRFWIDDNGGADKLPLHGYWTLYDRQMWAMGYSKCK